jgi:uncharacterized repeat protein (TIGR01451 family)
VRTRGSGRKSRSTRTGDDAPEPDCYRRRVRGRLADAVSGRRRFTPAVVLSVALLCVPGVLAQGGGGGGAPADRVTICHALAGSAYGKQSAPEADFYGVTPRRHGAHRRDIVPPFVVERPRPGDPSSFPGRNWRQRGQAILDRGCALVADKVRICHATNSALNPYVVQAPAIENNGDLGGGHLNHEGPIYPAKHWGDIIPPYDYVDEDGETQVFPGYNWDVLGQAIWEHGCEPPPPPEQERITPLVDCVEATEEGFLAHFGYDNPNSTTVEPPSSQNFFAPLPPNRGQPTAFASGRVEDAFQVDWDGGILTWSLTGNALAVSRSSRRCEGSITVVKRLVPAADPGRFDLEIDGEVAGGAIGVGDGDTTGTIAVTADRHTVGESGAAGTSLGDYSVEIVCRGDGGDGAIVAGASGPSVDVQVRRNDAVVCTITNTAEQEAEPQPPTPSQQLDIAVVKTANPTTVVVGQRITWTMTVTNRSSVAADDVNGVKVNDPRSYRTRLVSLRASQGTCKPFTCNLGRLAPGASASVVAVTVATQVGVVVDVVRVGSEEVESNYRNNVAAALARVVGPFVPPTGLDVCRTLTAAPTALQAGRSSIVRLRALNRRGEPLLNVVVRARGPGVEQRARTDRRGFARVPLLATQVGLVHFVGGRPRVAGCLTRLGVVRGRATSLTG